MRYQSVLMGSVSIVAMAASAAAHAQDTTVPEGYSVSIEGGVLFGPNTAAEDKLGSGFSGGVVDIGDNIGYRAAVSIGKQIDPFWDLRATAALNHQLVATSTESAFFSSGSGSGSSGFFGELKNSFNYETLDFEAGYRPELDANLNVRLFGGVRGLHYKESMDKLGVQFGTDGSGSSFSVSATTESTLEFIGAGPRVGVEASSRLGDSMFGISGMVGAAAMYGVERSNFNGSIDSSPSGGPSGPIPPSSDEEWKWVYSLEAALGVDVYLSEQAKLTVGVRAEQIGNVGFDDSTRLNYGPTLKFTAQY